MPRKHLLWSYSLMKEHAQDGYLPQAAFPDWLGSSAYFTGSVLSAQYGTPNGEEPLHIL